MAEDGTPCPGDDTLLGLALGELTGRGRADALAHVADCATCRHHVHDLVETAEQLMLAAPEAEPPAGFESAVLGRLGATPIRQTRPMRRRFAAAAVTLVLAVTAAVALTTSGDSRTEFAEAAMITPSGRNVGRTWRYNGQPTWVLVSVPRWNAWDRTAGTPREYRLRATLDDGSELDLGALEFATPAGSWGTTTHIDATHIRAVTVTDTTGHVWCRGTF